VRGIKLEKRSVYRDWFIVWLDRDLKLIYVFIRFKLFWMRLGLE